MTAIPTLDPDYWEAVEILAEEHGRVKECIDGETAWTPVDPGNLAWAIRVYRNLHQDDPDRHFLTFPWPEPGEESDIPDHYLKPTEEKKGKIQWAMDNCCGEGCRWITKNKRRSN